MTCVQRLMLMVQMVNVKNLFVYIVTAIVLLHIFNVAVIYVEFKLNQDYIAEVLCINKDVPDSDCHGCCQLKKEISEQEEQKHEEEAVRTGEKLLWTVNNDEAFCFSLAETYVEVPLKPYCSHPYSMIPFDIFHPPQVFSA